MEHENTDTRFKMRSQEVLKTGGPVTCQTRCVGRVACRERGRRATGPHDDPSMVTWKSRSPRARRPDLWRRKSSARMNPCAQAHPPICTRWARPRECEKKNFSPKTPQRVSRGNGEKGCEPTAAASTRAGTRTGRNGRVGKPTAFLPREPKPTKRGPAAEPSRRGAPAIARLRRLLGKAGEGRAGEGSQAPS